MKHKQDFKILIVDDEPLVRETMKKVLVDKGYDVLAAEDAHAALQLVRNTPVNAALLDIRLPGMNGVELFEKIKLLRPDVQVIMMTAYEVEELVNRAFKRGVFACLHKPFDMTKLHQLLEQIREKV